MPKPSELLRGTEYTNFSAPSGLFGVKRSILTSMFSTSINIFNNNSVQIKELIKRLMAIKFENTLKKFQAANE